MTIKKGNQMKNSDESPNVFRNDKGKDNEKVL